jgi:hypothetical protein
VFGGIGQGAGVPAALVVSAGALAPTVPILIAAGRSNPPAADREPQRPVVDPVTP